MSGSRKSPIAMACTSVFALPPRLAGMIPWRSTENRSTVTPTSRPMITTVTHQGTMLSIETARPAPSR